MTEEWVWTSSWKTFSDKQNTNNELVCDFSFEASHPNFLSFPESEYQHSRKKANKAAEKLIRMSHKVGEKLS